MENRPKLVDFCKWCDVCKHQRKPETEEPCYTCLNQPVNYDSRKPVEWEEDK